MAIGEDRIRWFGLGLFLGAAAAAVCAMLAQSGRADRRHVAPVPAGPILDSGAGLQADEATDVVEFRGFVIHVFCHALGAGRYKALCDIWESGAVVLEGGTSPMTYPTPEEARAAAIDWARQWVLRNG